MSKSTELARQALQALQVAEARDDPMERVAALAEARDRLDAAYNEALAEAVVSGRSFREVAQAAGVAPNSVSPRLARTSLLSAYASQPGRVAADDVTIAQHELRESGSDAVPPMRFIPRTKSTGGDPT